MKKYFSLVLLFVFLAIEISAQEYLNGKVRVVNSFPDYKVRIVKSFPDLKVQVVTSFPDKPGKWQFVDSFEDFSIQFVDSFEDFTIQFVESFPGPSYSYNTTHDVPQCYSGNVTVIGSGEKIAKANYNITIDKDSFFIPRLPNRSFPLNARVQIVDTLPDIIIKLSSDNAHSTLRLEMDTVISFNGRYWQVVDTLPDFRVMFYNYWKWCDLDVDVINYYDNDTIHTLIYNNRIFSEKQYPNPNEKAPLPDCKEKGYIYF